MARFPHFARAANTVAWAFVSAILRRECLLWKPEPAIWTFIFQPFLWIERQMSSRDAGDPCQVHRYPGGIFHISCKMMAFPWASGCWNHWNGKVTCPNWYLQILDKGQRRATLEWAVNYKRIWGTALTPWLDLSWTTSQRVFIPLHTSDCIVPSTFLCNAKSCQSLLSFWSFSSWARVNVGRSPLLGVGGMGGSPSISLFVGGLLKHLFKRVALPSTVNPVNMKNEAKNVRKNQQKSTTQKKYHEMSCTPPFPLISSQPDTRIATRKSNCNGWSVLRPVYHAKKVVTLPIITHFGGKGFPQLSNIWRAKGLKLTVCFLKLNCLDQQKNNEQTKRALPNCKVIKHGNIHQLLNPNHNSFPSCFCSHPTTSTLLSPKEDRWLWRAAGISDTMLPSPQREWRELRRRLSRKSSNMVSMWPLKKKRPKVLLGWLDGWGKTHVKRKNGRVCCGLFTIHYLQPLRKVL